jgi:hypothetical protein
MTAGQAEMRGDLAERVAGMLNDTERYVLEAAGTIQAGTQMVHALDALARSWEDQARASGVSAAAETWRRCAADLLRTVLRAHGRGGIPEDRER